jgi:RNA polymerase-binding transcription factor DksA
MAKKKTSQKTSTTKNKTKSLNKTKKTSTVKKTRTAKTVNKKKADAKGEQKKKTTTKNVTAKKAAPPKAAKSVKKVVKKPLIKKTKTKKAEVKKPMAPEKKETVKKTAAPGTKAAIKITALKSKGKIVKKEEVKKPVINRAEALQKIKGYGKKDLEEFRTIIIEKRDEIIEDLQSLKEQMLDPTTGEYINENSPYSLHMAEQGTDAMEREKTFLYAQRENKFLAYLDDALKRIDSGSYGICVECIEEPQNLCETCPLIPKARLIAVPHTQHCLPVKQRKSGQ